MGPAGDTCGQRPSTKRFKGPTQDGRRYRHTVRCHQCQTVEQKVAVIGSAHFNPVTTLAFALRRDMGWAMAAVYWVVQLTAGVSGSLLARAFFGPAGHLAATVPPHGHAWQAAGFEAVLTSGLVLMILSLANGPKLNGPFIPLAVGASIMAWGTMGEPFDGASMNPARSFGPDVAIRDLTSSWVYFVGPVVGAVIAVAFAEVLRGPARAQEARAAEGTPLNREA